MSNGICWCCGKNKATTTVYGYPLCDKCSKLDIDPEEMEEVVIQSLEKGRIMSLLEIRGDCNEDT